MKTTELIIVTSKSTNKAEDWLAARVNKGSGNVAAYYHLSDSRLPNDRVETLFGEVLLDYVRPNVHVPIMYLLTYNQRVLELAQQHNLTILDLDAKDTD